MRESRQRGRQRDRFATKLWIRQRIGHLTDFDEFMILFDFDIIFYKFRDPKYGNKRVNSNKYGSNKSPVWLT